MTNTNKVFTTAVTDRYLTTEQLAKLAGLTKAQVSSATHHLKQEGSFKGRPAAGMGTQHEFMRIKDKRPKGVYARKNKAPSQRRPISSDPLERLLSAAAEIEEELHELREFKAKFNRLMND